MFVWSSTAKRFNRSLDDVTLLIHVQALPVFGKVVNADALCTLCTLSLPQPQHSSSTKMLVRTWLGHETWQPLSLFSGAFFMVAALAIVMKDCKLVSDHYDMRLENFGSCACFLCVFVQKGVVSSVSFVNRVVASVPRVSSFDQVLDDSRCRFSTWWESLADVRRRLRAWPRPLSDEI